MEEFKCYECGYLTTDQSKINNHMQENHSIKVVQEEMSRSNFYYLCSYKSRDMSEFKNHMINEHEKASHEWWTEGIKSEFYCDECDIEIKKKELYIEHMDNIHSGDIVIKSEHYKVEVTGGN